MAGIRRTAQPPRINRRRVPSLGRISPGTVTPVPAVLSSATVENATPNTLTVIFNKAITSAAYTTGVSITINGTPVTGLASATVSPSNTIVYTFTENVVNGDTVLYNYTPGDYTDSDSLAVAAIANQAVTNNVLIAAPVFSGTIPTLDVTVNLEITPVDYSTFFTGSGITYSWINGIPTGLSLDPSTGILTGTPTVEIADISNSIRATNSTGSADSNNFTVNVTAAATFSVENQVLSRGTLTRASHAAHTFTASEGTIDSIGTVTGPNNGDFTVSESGGTVTIVPSGNGLANGPYSITVPCLDSGAQQVDVTVSITTIADTYTVGPEGEQADVAELTTAAYGQRMEILPGDYNVAQSDIRWTRTTEFTGTFDGTNHFEVTPASGTVTIHRLDIRNSNDINPAFRMNGLTFTRPALGGAQNFEPAMQLAGGAGTDWNIIFENCLFENDPTYNGTGNIHTGLRANTGAREVTVRNCTFRHVFNAMNFQNSSNLDILSNTIENCWGDATFISAPETAIGGVAGEINYSWNVARGLRPITADQHQDFFQFFGNNRTEVDNVVCRGNSHLGQGTEGAEVITNQGFLIRGADRLYGVIIEFNRYVGGAFIGIQTENCVNPIIQGNTIIRSPDNTTQTPFIRPSDCFHTVVRYNIIELYSPVNDNDSNPTPAEVAAINTTLSLSDQASFTANFAANPFPNGDEITNSDTQMAIVDGSAADITTPVHGAHQDIVVQSTETIDTSTYSALAPGPFLYNSQDDGIGTDGYTGSIETNTTTGNIYYVVTESATAPTPAQIIAGQDNTGTAAPASATLDVTARGVQNLSGTGLSGGTAYTIHFVWRSDDTLTLSDVWSSDGFATDSDTVFNTVQFPGTAITRRGGALTGVSDTQTGMWHVTLDMNSTGETDYVWWLESGANDCYLRRFNSNRFQCRIRGTGAEQIDLVSDVITEDGFINVLIGIDFNGDCKMWIDTATTSSLQASTTKTGTDNIPLSSMTNYEIGGNIGSANLNADVSAYYFKSGIYQNVEDAAVRNQYWNPVNGEPRDYSNAPASPEVQFTGNAAAWNAGTNEGTGGNFTMTGAVTDV